jgi:polyvinyl alcohol dehydrogenase (cytochrome)
MRPWPARTIHSLLIPVIAAATLAGQAAAAPARTSPDGWPAAGHDIANTHNATAEHTIRPGNASRLSTAWRVTTSGDVRTTPTVSDGTVYAPDSGGTLWAVAADTGRVRWSHSVVDYTGIAGDVSRTSPAVYGDELVLGDSAPLDLSGHGPGAVVVAVDRRTGQLLWRTQVDTHPAAVVTSSPVIYQGTIYVGVSSNEEVVSAGPGYLCCSFRGSVVALDTATGKLLWQTHTVPIGYSGGAVWGSTPAIDPRNNLIYVGTGNNYSAPAGVCATPGQTGCTPPSPDDHADSILALDRTTGAVRWFKSTLSSDVDNLICGANPSNECGPDFDFGSGPNLIRLASGRELVGIGQKSGVYWALDPNTGAVLWHTMVGPGSAFGGIQFGSATDGRRIYVAISNFAGEPYSITSAAGVTATTSGGSWAALDAATGKIAWQVADPQGAADMGFVSSANGVVYAGSTADTGNDMYALDARSGAILWSFASGGPVISGAAVVDGTVYWGSGYALATACPNGVSAIKACAAANNKLYAFRLPSGR